jgi:hypothetical protein
MLFIYFFEARFHVIVKYSNLFCSHEPTLCNLQIKREYQSLVSLVVIDAEFGKEDHSPISCNCNRKWIGTTLMPELIPELITEPEATGDESKKESKKG